MVLAMTGLILLLLFFSGGYSDEVKFPKDQRIDYPFPQKIALPSSPGLPIGHLRPLGHQRRSTGPVMELKEVAVPFETSAVYRSAVTTELPVWTTIEDIKADADKNRKTFVTQKKNDGRLNMVGMKLSEFYEDYGSEEWWIDELMGDLKAIETSPKLPCLTSVTRSISSGLTTGIMTLSDQTTNQLICCFSGRRDYIVMEKNPAAYTTLKEGGLCSDPYLVDLNTDLVNVFDSAWVTGSKWRHTQLYKGDCLYIPPEHMTHWTSYGSYQGITYTWHNLTEEDGEPCSPLTTPILSQSSNSLELYGSNSTESKSEKLRRLFEINTNETGELEVNCLMKILNHVFNDKITVEEFRSAVGVETLTLKKIKELSRAKLDKLLKTLETGQTHQHQHDEL